jgi:hypothetical protein
MMARSEAVAGEVGAAAANQPLSCSDNSTSKATPENHQAIKLQSECATPTPTSNQWPTYYHQSTKNQPWLHDEDLMPFVVVVVVVVKRKVTKECRSRRALSVGKAYHYKPAIALLLLFLLFLVSLPLPLSHTNQPTHTITMTGRQGLL